MHRRRGVGVSAVKKKQASEQRYATLADKLEATRDEHVAQYIASFRVALEAFAKKYKKKIRTDAVFRTRFTEMCYEIGVDPLQSGKGFWSEILGVGDFYYELGIKIVQICAATRPLNGGLLALDELEGHLNRRGGADASGSRATDTDRGPRITREDVKRAIAKLDVLGEGFRVVNDAVVVSVPTELNRDHVVALDAARRHHGRLTVSTLRTSLPQCTPERAHHLLSHLAKDGFAWIDDGETNSAPARDRADGPRRDDDDVGGKKGERAYYFPSIWLEAISSQPVP